MSSSIRAASTTTRPTKDIVLLGAGSDVASRYVFPALAELEAANLLPRGLRILAVTRQPWHDVRHRIETRVKKHHASLGRGVLKKLFARVRRESADLTDPQELKAVITPLRGPLILYFGLPPSITEAIVDNLQEVRLPPHSRVMLEKPFGKDEKSAKALNRQLLKLLPEGDIFRVDHFLAKQTVQNVLGLRFANRVLESAWDREHVEKVEIVWEETNGLGGRAGYYDSAGALKDMIQNHLLQLMCMLAMEPPSRLTESELRDRKTELLRAIRSLSEQEMDAHTSRGRYTAGRINGRSMCGYAKEAGVEPRRQTETFAEVRLFVDNHRWRGIPFVLRTGKAMKENRQELTVFFKPSHLSTFGSSQVVTSNQLRLGLNTAQVGLTINVNGPGNPLEADPVELCTELAPEPLSAYASLFLDVMDGNATFFIRNDEAQEAWRIIDPIVAAWQKNLVPLQSYRAGSSGPSALR